MPAETPMRDSILDAAEQRMRSVGYNAVSFRDLATDVNIKSASIHYYFPTKADLGAHLVDRYAQRFQEGLGEIDPADLQGAIGGFLRLYADALIVGETMCLCAVLGAEANGLPGSVKDRVGGFFRQGISWLADLNARHGLAGMDPSPAEIVSGLEGAMIVATATSDRGVLDRAIERIATAYRQGVRTSA